MTEEKEPIPFEGEKGLPECLSFEPKGYRDLFWCAHLNEPILLEYRNSGPHCTDCGGPPTVGHHFFIAHVYKPWGLEAEAARGGRKFGTGGRK